MISIETINGAVLLSAVVRTRRRRNEHKVEMVDLFLTDGSKHEITVQDWDRVQMRAVKIMPAEADIKLLGPYVDENSTVGALASRTPVIAWALCVDGEIRCVTPAGVNDGSTSIYGGLYVEMPDGEVLATDSWTDPWKFDDARSYLKHYAAARERERAAADAEPAA